MTEATDSAHAPSTPCPCCGYVVHELGTGMSEICPICRWEDDIVQLRWPDYRGGANNVSLLEGQANYARLGVSDPSKAERVRDPQPDEQVDMYFHPIGPGDGPFDPNGQRLGDWPSDVTSLYWWRPGFWQGPTSEAGERN